MTRLDLTLPRGWQELTDEQLRFVFHLLIADMPAVELQTRCLIKWGGLHIIQRNRKSGTYIIRQGRDYFEITPLMLTDVLPALDWLSNLPSAPVRMSKLGKHQALPADFQGVSFETYVIVDNLYQGYLSTHNDAILDQLAAILYPGLSGALAPWQRISVFYWVASLKDFLSRRFSEFFQPTANSNLLGSSAPNVEEAMNAQIRALTKGDITKEAEVLSLDAWRALTELNAQAKEYRELNEKIKK